MASLLLDILQLFFPALSRALIKHPWTYMSATDNLESISCANDLQVPHPDDNMSDSSDEEDDVITSYDGSAPASPIQSFGDPTPTPAPTHPDNSQFSTVVSVGTPYILHAAHSNVTASPSLIRDTCLAAAPYSTPAAKSGSGSSS